MIEGILGDSLRANSKPGFMTDIYLDNNATTRMSTEVRESILQTMSQPLGNASSVHRAGGVTREIQRNAREQVAAFLGANPDAVLFTSGATEANNMVLRTFGREFGGRRIIASAIEHSSIKQTLAFLEHRGVSVSYIPVDRDGLVDPDAIRELLTEDVSLVSVQWVNNETGVVQPIESIGRLCEEHGVPFHTDAAQAPGKMVIELQSLPVDYASFTGHKFHAPAGIGALYRRRGARLQPLLMGGDQESGTRAGTENLIGIVGMGTAAASRLANFTESVEHMRELRDRFEARLKERFRGITVNGAPNRACNTSNLRFEGVDGQALVARLDQRGIYCSQSSACTNHRPEPSYVLRATGLTEAQAYESVRFGFSVQNTQAEVDEAVATITDIGESIRSFHVAAT